MATERISDLQVGITQPIPVAIVNDGPVKSVTADQTFASASLASVTELAAEMKANVKYILECDLFVTDADDAEGLKVGVNGPAGAAVEFSATRVSKEAPLTLSSPQTALNAAITFAAASAKLNSSPAQIRIRGFISCGGTAGNCQIQAGVATAPGAGEKVTVQAKSTLRLTRVGN